MNYLQELALAGRAVRPAKSQYFFFYVTPDRFGWSVAATDSYNSLEQARQEFLNDFWDDHPRLVAASCPGCN